MSTKPFAIPAAHAANAHPPTTASSPAPLVGGVPLAAPALWPCSTPATVEQTSVAALSYDEEQLVATFDCHGRFAPPQGDTTLARWEAKEGVPESRRTILADDRVALFVWLPGTRAYHGFEANAGGNVVSYRVDMAEFARTGAMDFACLEGEAAAAADVAVAPQDGTTRVVLAVRWSALGAWRPGHTGTLMVQLNRNHRGTAADVDPVQTLSTHATLSGVGGECAGSQADQAAAAEGVLWASFGYSCATPCEDAIVNFHRPAMFAAVHLEGIDTSS